MNPQHNRSHLMFWLGVVVLSVFFAWNNSLTVTADLVRNQVTFKAWHPYVWELTSMVAILILYVGVFKLARTYPLIQTKWQKSVLIHLLASVVFSIAHVLLMVGLRKLIYAFMGGTYDFGDWASELLYEYRKDMVSYFSFVVLLAAYDHFVLSRQQEPPMRKVKKIQIKNKQGVFWLKQDEIITIESGGNYVYFHVNDQVIPMRTTMAEVIHHLDDKYFLRVHRSYIVNLIHSKVLRRSKSDSNELELKNGKTVPVSKTYRADLLRALNQQAD